MNQTSADPTLLTFEQYHEVAPAVVPFMSSLERAFVGDNEDEYHVQLAALGCLHLLVSDGRASLLLACPKLLGLAFVELCQAAS
jgi:hypothetical protein